jgi:hypothetical protein
MSGIFHVDMPAVTRLAGTFTERQGIPSEAGQPMRESAGGVRTGDPALDAETNALFEQYQELLDRIGQVIGYGATALTEVVDSTGQFDAAKAGQQRELTPSDVGYA